MEGRRLIVVTRPGNGLGLRLTGATVLEVPPGEEAARLASVFADPQLGIAAVEEAVLGAAPEALVRRATARGVLLVPFALPSRWSEAGPGERYIAAMIRRAIGYQIRIDRGAPAGGAGGRR